MSKAVLAIVVTATCASFGSASSSLARGFCNADHVGNDEQQQLVASAAADFYEGSENLMAMLKASELSDSEAFEASGESAVARFGDSAKGYKGAAEAFSNIDVIADVNIEVVGRMSGISNPDFLSPVMEIGDAEDLLLACAEKSEGLGVASSRLWELGISDASTRDISDIFNELSSSLAFGSVVSAIFWAVGGAN